MNLRDKTNGELMTAAGEAGFRFSLSGGSISIASPTLGSDRDQTRRACLIHGEMRRRWEEFVAFVGLRLAAETFEETQ